MPPPPPRRTTRLVIVGALLLSLRGDVPQRAGAAAAPLRAADVAAPWASPHPTPDRVREERYGVTDIDGARRSGLYSLHRNG